MDWKKEFDKEFVMSDDNGSGPQFLFKTYPPDNIFPSGSLSIARPEHIKEFIENHVLQNKTCIDVIVKAEFLGNNR